MKPTETPNPVENREASYFYVVNAIGKFENH